MKTEKKISEKKDKYCQQPSANKKKMNDSNSIRKLK